MIRGLIAAGCISAVFSASAASAETRCHKGVEGVLSVEEWSAASVEGTYSDSIKLQLLLKNELSDQIRMVDGKIYFEDVLGRPMVNISLDEDLRVDAGESTEQSGHYSGGGSIDRLAVISPEDVVSYVCVSAAVSGQGEVKRFDE